MGVAAVGPLGGVGSGRRAESARRNRPCQRPCVRGAACVSGHLQGGARLPSMPPPPTEEPARDLDRFDPAGRRERRARRHLPAHRRRLEPRSRVEPVARDGERSGRTRRDVRALPGADEATRAAHRRRRRSRRAGGVGHQRLRLLRRAPRSQARDARSATNRSRAPWRSTTARRTSPRATACCSTTAWRSPASRRSARTPTSSACASTASTTRRSCAATALAAFYNHVNRVVGSVGVELEPDVPAWEFGAQK